MTKTNNIVLKISNLSFSYKNNSDFSLNNINLDIEQGKIYAFLGKNGSGKSTLLHTISGINKNYEGQILVSNNGKFEDLKNLKNKDRAKLISLVPQQTISNTLNVYDTVMLGRMPHINVSPSMVDYEMTSRAITNFNLNHLNLKATNQLSGGELQSVAIARAFAQNAPIMLLDEPTNNLDVKKQNELFKIIKCAVREKNLTVICVLHDINHAIKYADHLVFLNNGKLNYVHEKNSINEKLLKDIYGISTSILNIKNNKYIIFND